jgi:hypothetical protein
MVFTSLSNAFSSGAEGGRDDRDNSAVGVNRRRLEEEYGLAKEVQIELDKLVFKSTFGEDTSGANDEALLCLRKGGTWGEADDYAEYVKRLAELERRRLDEIGSPPENSRLSRLKVRTYFAESDAMSGRRGQAYVEECWKGAGDDLYQDVIDFQFEVLPGSDHDSIVQSVAALERVFRDAGGRICSRLDFAQRVG